MRLVCAAAAAGDGLLPIRNGNSTAGSQEDFGCGFGVEVEFDLLAQRSERDVCNGMRRMTEEHRGCGSVKAV